MRWNERSSSSSGVAYTTRVDREFGLYRVGQVFTTPLGVVEILEVTSYPAGALHPFDRHLTDEERAQIKGPFDVVKFSYQR